LKKPARFQSIHRRRDRSAGKQDLAPDSIHWLRPFVQQELKHGEVGEAKSEPCNTALGIAFDRTRSLKQDRPYMYSAFPLHAVIMLYFET
jgi:hypothetical protein